MYFFSEQRKVSASTIVHTTGPFGTYRQVYNQMAVNGGVPMVQMVSQGGVPMVQNGSVPNQMARQGGVQWVGQSGVPMVQRVVHDSNQSRSEKGCLSKKQVSPIEKLQRNIEQNV